MRDELVDADEEVLVGLGFHVERRGAEDRRVQPRPGLRRCHPVAKQVVGRRSPARRAHYLPLRPFAFGQVNVGVARKRSRRDSVNLKAQPHAIAPRPVVKRREEAFVEQLRQCPSPVVADVRCLRPHLRDERRQIRPQVVAAPSLELVEEIVSPVLVIDLQAVAENRVRSLRAESLHQTVAHRLQVVFGRGLAEVVEHEAFGADGWALDHHPRPAGDEEEQFVPAARARRDLNRAVLEVSDLAQAVGRDALSLRARQEDADQLLARADVGQGRAARVRVHLHALRSQHPRRLAHRDLRPAVRPAAAERQVHAQA